MLNVYGLYHTSKYDSGLLFGLDLVVTFVDLTITFETNLLNYDTIREYETNTSYFFHRQQLSVYVWTEENDSNTLRVDANFFKNGGKNLRFQKYPDTCGQGLIAVSMLHH